MTFNSQIKIKKDLHKRELGAAVHYCNANVS